MLHVAVTPKTMHSLKRRRERSLKVAAQLPDGPLKQDVMEGAEKDRVLIVRLNSLRRRLGKSAKH